jgi:hypothetical protein
MMSTLSENKLRSVRPHEEPVHGFQKKKKKKSLT